MRTVLFIGMLAIANAISPDAPDLVLKADLYMVITIIALFSDLAELYYKSRKK